MAQILLLCTRAWLNSFMALTPAHAACQVEAHADSSTYWRMLGLVLRQFDGIVAGYEARLCADEPSSLPALTRRDLMFLNGNGALGPLPASRRGQTPSCAGSCDCCCLCMPSLSMQGLLAER